MGGLIDIMESYRGLTIEINKSGQRYKVYDYGKITNEPIHIGSGASVRENAFDLEFVKKQVDAYFEEKSKNNG